MTLLTFDASTSILLGGTLSIIFLVVALFSLALDVFTVLPICVLSTGALVKIRVRANLVDLLRDIDLLPRDLLFILLPRDIDLLPRDIDLLPRDLLFVLLLRDLLFVLL
ncbi:MAG TPA: hypothetical protein DCF84_01480, partial [Bacteroidetes bacterium]|nr:hypothetical protein [Bacteroidota bacterium]